MPFNAHICILFHIISMHSIPQLFLTLIIILSPIHSSPLPTMSFTGIPPGQILDIKVVAAEKLLDKELFGHMDPYVELEYGSNKYRTKISKKGGQNPNFGDTFQITLGSNNEIIVSAWNSNKMRPRNFIGSCRVQLDKVKAQDYDERTWSLQTNDSSYAGELKLIMRIDIRQAPAYLSYPAQNY